MFRCVIERVGAHRPFCPNPLAFDWTSAPALVERRESCLVDVCCPSPEPETNWRTAPVQPPLCIGRYEGTDRFLGRRAPPERSLHSLSPRRENLNKCLVQRNYQGRGGSRYNRPLPHFFGLYCISEAGIKGLPSKASLMASKTFLAFFRAVARYPRMRPKRLAPSSVRNPPETCCLTFTIRISRSPWLLSNGMRKSDMNANTWPWKSRRRMSKFTGGACLGRPRFFPSPLVVGVGAEFASNPT